MFANSKVIEVPGMLSCWEEAAGWECQTCLGAPSSHRISSQDGGGEQHWDHRAQPRWAVPELQWNSHLNTVVVQRHHEDKTTTKVQDVLPLLSFLLHLFRSLQVAGDLAELLLEKAPFLLKRVGKKLLPVFHDHLL